MVPGPPERLNKLKNRFFETSENFKKLQKIIKNPDRAGPGRTEPDRAGPSRTLRIRKAKKFGFFQKVCPEIQKVWMDPKSLKRISKLFGKSKNGNSEQFRTIQNKSEQNYRRIGL